MVSNSMILIDSPLDLTKADLVEKGKWSSVHQLADSAISSAFVKKEVENREDDQKSEVKVSSKVSSIFRRTIGAIEHRPIQTFIAIVATATLGYHLVFAASTVAVVAGAALLGLALTFATLKVVALIHLAQVKYISRIIDRLELAGLLTVQMSNNLKKTISDLEHEPALYQNLIQMQLKEWKSSARFSKKECDFLEKLLAQKGIYQMFKEIRKMSFDEKGETRVGRNAKSIQEEVKTSVLQLHSSTQIMRLLKAVEKNDQVGFGKALVQHFKEMAEKNKEDQNMVNFYKFQELARKIEDVSPNESFATFVRLQRYQNLFDRHSSILSDMIKGLNGIHELNLDRVDSDEVEGIQEKLEKLHKISGQLLEDYTLISTEVDDTFAYYRGNFAQKYRIIDELLNRLDKEAVHTFGELPMVPGFAGKVSKKKILAPSVDPKQELEKKKAAIQKKLNQTDLDPLEKERLESHIKSLDRSIADLAKVEKINKENNFTKTLSPADKKTVLIATCSFGTGHKQTAQALKSHIGEAANVTIIDPTDYETGIFVREIDWLYKLGKKLGKQWSSVYAFNWILTNQKYWMVNFENSVDRLICKIFGKTKSGIAKSARGVETTQKNLLRQRLLMERPDLITTTYHMDLNPFVEVAEELGIPLIHVPTDFDVKMDEVFGKNVPNYSNFKIFLPEANARTLETAEHLGLDKCHFLKGADDDVQVTGIALRPEFYIQRTQEEIDQIKKEKGIDPEATVVLVLSGGNGQELPYPEMLLNSKDNGKKYHMIVVAGGNKTAGINLNAKRKEGDRFVKGKNPNVTIEVAEDPSIASNAQPYYISASELSRLQAISDVAITKPGGLSIGELLQTGVPMIPDRRITPMAWEDFNINVIENEERGKPYTGKEKILKLIDEVASLGKKPKDNYSKWFTREMSRMIEEAEDEGDETMVHRRAYRKS